MGMARNAGSGNWRSKGSQRNKALKKANETKGVPIPGTGVSRWSWRGKPQHRNRAGALGRHLRWSDNPIEEAALMNLNKAAHRENIAEAVDELIEEQFDIYTAEGEHVYTWGSAEEAGMESLGDLPPNVTFNGEPAEHWADDDPDYRWADDHEGFLARRIQSLETELETAQFTIEGLQSKLTSSEHLSQAYDAGWAGGVRFGKMEIEALQTANTEAFQARLAEFEARLREAFFAGWWTDDFTAPEVAFEKWMNQ